MSDGRTRIDPVPHDSVALMGASMTMVPAAKRYNLRGAATDLQAFTRVPLPTKIGDVSDHTAGIAIMLGPDEWLLIGAVTGDGAGLPLSITEITERQIGITLDGPRAVEILMSGCPLDLERMAIGRGTRTIYETVEIIVIKRDEQSFHVEVWRSFAPWLWAALSESAAS